MQIHLGRQHNSLEQQVRNYRRKLCKVIPLDVLRHDSKLGLGPDLTLKQIQLNNLLYLVHERRSRSLGAWQLPIDVLNPTEHILIFVHG
jgi:hypothetical protein